MTRSLSMTTLLSIAAVLLAVPSSLADHTPRLSIQALEDHVNDLEAAAAALDPTTFPPGAAQHGGAASYTHWDWSNSSPSTGGPGYVNYDSYLQVGHKGRKAFFSSDFNFNNAGTGYMGLQVGAAAGEVAIFSIWNATEAIAGPSATCASFGHEGSGYSCQMPYPIEQDHLYRIRLWRLATDPDGQWWGAWVRDTVTGVETQIGSIKAPVANSEIVYGGNWIEYFGPQVECEEVPLSIAYWAPPQMNWNGVDGYAYAPTFSGGHVGFYSGAQCAFGLENGGSVEAFDFGWAQGARVIMGGWQPTSTATPPH